MKPAALFALARKSAEEKRREALEAPARVGVDHDRGLVLDLPPRLFASRLADLRRVCRPQGIAIRLGAKELYLDAVTRRGCVASRYPIPAEITPEAAVNWRDFATEAWRIHQATKSMLSHGVRLAIAYDPVTRARTLAHAAWEPVSILALQEPSSHIVIVGRPLAGDGSTPRVETVTKCRMEKGDEVATRRQREIVEEAVRANVSTCRSEREARDMLRGAELGGGGYYGLAYKDQTGRWVLEAMVGNEAVKLLGTLEGGWTAQRWQLLRP